MTYKMLFCLLGIFSVQLGLSQVDSLGISGDSIVTELKEVTIEGKKNLFTRKVDRLVFNVENSIFAGTGDIIDAFKIIPGVMVQNDMISIIGKSAMAVMINDKMVNLGGEELMAYLRTLPASGIKRIEVITTPPSKYDAAGNSGIINIITKRPPVDSWSADLQSSYRQQSYAGGGLGANFYYNKKNISFFTTNSLGENTRKISYRNKIFYDDQVWSGRSPQKNASHYYSNRTGFDFRASEKIRFGVQYIGSFSKASSTTAENIAIASLSGQEQYSIISSGNTRKRPNDFNNFNLYTIVDLDTLGRRVNIDLDYFKNGNVTRGTVSGMNFAPDGVPQDGTYFAFDNDNFQDIKNLSSKVDVDYPVEFANFSAGGKFSRSTTDNNFLFYNSATGTPVLDGGQSNKFEYKESIYAIYVSGYKNIGENWSLQLGLRYEGTETNAYSYNNAQRNTNSYSKIFPTAHLTYKMPENRNLSATYSKRINRPNFEQLNPFRSVINPYQYVEGNPFLQPSYSDNYEIIYNIRDNEVKLYINDNKSLANQVAQIDPETNVVSYNYYNYLDIFQIGIVGTYVFNKLDWLNSANVFTANYFKSSSSLPYTLQKQDGYGAYASTNNDIILNHDKTYFMSIGYFYVFPSKYEVSEGTGYGSLSAGLKGQFLNKSLTISASFNDILGSERRTVTTFSNGIRQEYRNYWDVRQFRIMATFTFGNKKVYVRERGTSNESERNRI